MEFKDILIPVKTKQSPVGTLQFEETRKWPGCSSEAIVFIFPVVTLAAVMFEELVMKIKCELCVILCITNVSFIYIYTWFWFSLAFYFTCATWSMDFVSVFVNCNCSVQTSVVLIVLFKLQDCVPIGDGVVSTHDTCFAPEICEELWNPRR